MSEYHEQYDSTNIRCPYCKYEYQPEADTYDEDARVEECGDCGKKYYRIDSFSIDHTTAPSCELNGLDHRWEPAVSTKLKSEFCAVCGDVRLTD